MATTGRLELRGLGEYLEALVQAGKDVDAAAARALEAGAQPILAEMERLVPVGSEAEGDPHPGNLKKHLGIDGPKREGNYTFVNVGVIGADEETAIYGNVQEYGSGSNEAQPYVRPALKSKKAAAMKAMKDSLKGEGLL